MLAQTIAVVSGMGLIAFLWWLGLRRLRMIDQALVTEAVVIELMPVETMMEPGGISHVPKLRFCAHDGTEHIVTRVYSSPRRWRAGFRVGQRVRIAYDPKTGNAEIFRRGYKASLLSWLVLLTAAILGILWALIAD